jgi:hypothetical protein
VTGRLAADGLTPRDALVLDGLAAQWGAIYKKLHYADGIFTAERWDGAPPLIAETLEGLASAMRAAYARSAR